MILQVLFIGARAQALADNVNVPGIDEFRIDGTLVLPTKGDRVTLKRKDSVEGPWLTCAGRRFDFAGESETVFTLGCGDREGYEADFCINVSSVQERLWESQSARTSRHSAATESGRRRASAGNERFRRSSLAALRGTTR